MHWSNINPFSPILATNEMVKTKQYHTVGTIPKSNIKIIERGTKSIPLTPTYMTTHFPGLVQAL